MLKLFKKLYTKDSTNTKSPVPQAILDSGKLCDLISCFPLGAGVKYFPEYRQEITLETVIIAYLINDEVVYANSEIRCAADKETITLNGTALEEINTFAFLIPSVNRGETELDYERKEILGKSGGFARGNTITLMGEPQTGKAPLIDTVVRKFARLKEGPYHKTQVVVLNADPSLLELNDQRNQVRLEAKISGLIQTKLYTEPNPCTIIDFSGKAIKVTCDDNEIIPMSCHEGESVTLTFDLPNSSEPSVMRGTVHRSGGASLIIELKDTLIASTFEKLEPIDLIEIKAKLLQQQPQAN